MKLIPYFFALVLLLPAGLVQAGDEPRNVDPFEAINRPLFELNNSLDRWLVRPVAKGYDWVMPGFAKRGVGNFFANLYDLNSAINGLLQARLMGAAQGGGRFAINSTVGILGLFDVATPMGIRPYRTDFGHTLAIWGVDKKQLTLEITESAVIEDINAGLLIMNGTGWPFEDFYGRIAI